MFSYNETSYHEWKSDEFLRNECKIIILVLYYDESSFNYIKSQYHEYLGKWMFPLFIHTTIYLENIVYLEWLEQHEDIWKDVDYIGTLSWKWNQKIGIPPLHAMMKLGHVDFDVMPFAYDRSINVVNQAVSCHPHFRTLWIVLLSRLGYEECDILSSSVPFFCYNYWMCRPEWMKRYCEFVKQIVHMMETHEDLHHLLWANANYRPGYQPSDAICAVMKNNYYTHHCFILERLPCFFFWKENATLQLRFPYKIWTTFDWKYYIQRNPDLSSMNAEEARQHFLQYGSIENRPFQRT